MDDEEHPKTPHIEIDSSMPDVWEINIWLADESNYCQLYVYASDGRIEFKSKETIEKRMLAQVRGGA